MAQSAISLSRALNTVKLRCEINGLIDYQYVDLDCYIIDRVQLFDFETDEFVVLFVYLKQSEPCNGKRHSNSVT